MTACTKLCHRSPAAARKWVKRTGGGYTAKHLYQCSRHGDEVVYHFTSQTPSPTQQDPRLKGVVAFALRK